jgi:hypothetical protein
MLRINQLLCIFALFPMHCSRERSIMEDQRFDAFAKSVAKRASRRRFLTGMLGLGAGVTVAVAATDSAGAARRGFAGPTLPRLMPPSMCGGFGASCASPDDCCSACCVSGGGGPFTCADENVCVV